MLKINLKKEKYSKSCKEYITPSKLTLDLRENLDST